MKRPVVFFAGSMITARSLAAALECPCLDEPSPQAEDAIEAFNTGRTDTLVATPVFATGWRCERDAIAVLLDDYPREERRRLPLLPSLSAEHNAMIRRVNQELARLQRCSEVVPGVSQLRQHRR